jgi:biotin carboxylase
MSSGKRILIFGGSHSELPLIKAAKKLGLTVLTSGNRPDHPGHLVSDEFHPADFSDITQMLEVTKKSKCDYIVSAANDYSYLSASAVAEQLNFPGFDGFETAKLIHHKHLFKPLAIQLGLPVTRFIVLDNQDITPINNANLNYPLIVKPVDLTGGKGINVVKNQVDVPAAIEKAAVLSKISSVVVEEFFDGSLHSYSTIIQNQKIVFEYTDNEYCYPNPNPYLVSTSTSIASVPSHIISDLKFQTEKLIKYLKLVDGILHCQFLYKQGEYVIVEYTRRMSGDLYSNVVEAVTGLRHSEQFIRSSIGISLELTRDKPIGDFISRHCIFPKKTGLYQSIQSDKKITPFIISLTNAFEPGYFFKEPLKEKAAVVLLSYPSHSCMLELYPMLNNLLLTEIN